MSRLPQRIATGVYQLAPGGLVLIDTSFSRSAARVGAAIRDLGRAPGDVRAIVVTHLHGDHTGALAEVKGRTGAEVHDGETLPSAVPRAMHTRGHTAGHPALLLPRDGGVLFVGDAATNLLRLG